MLIKTPFLKIVLFYVLGVLLATFLNVNLNIFYLLGLFVATFVAHIATHKNNRFRYVFALFFFLFLIVSGIYFTNKSQNKTQINTINYKGFVIARIDKEPVVKEKFVRTTLAIEAIRQNQNWIKSSGNILLILEKDSLASCLKKGDYIQFEPDFREIPPNKNPDAFDYKKYLFFHLISKQTYLKSNNWQRIKHTKNTTIEDKIASLRRFLLSKYKKYHIEGNELSVLSALTLAYKNELDSQIKNAYSHTGAIHVLAVSGLHVGIVFFIINYLLQFLNKGKVARFFRFIITLLGIWFFAFLTAATPSVLRASVMFSFITIGIYLHRNNSIFNTIFASAFFLLLWNPFLLFNLSFQLSYMALISIVYFQPIISKWFTFKYKILQWAWDLSAVSIAAQIGTFPITLYYFHQFPVYFWLSNWIVIPMATIIIWLAFIFFIFSSIPFIAQFLAYLLIQIIHYQNFIIQQIEQWPYAWIKDVYIDKWQISLLLVSVLLLMMLSYKLTIKRIYIFFIILLAFFIYTDLKIFSQYNQNQIVIYDIKKESAINFIYGKENILLSSIGVNKKDIQFHIKNHWLSMGLTQEKILSLKQLDKKYFLTNIFKAQSKIYFSKNNFIQFKNSKILILHKKKQLQFLKQKNIRIDLLIVSNNFRAPLDSINKYFQYKRIVIDASNSKKNELFWKQQASDKIYIVSEKGAFVQNI